MWGAMGVVEGLKRLPTFLAAKRRLIRRILRERPALVVAVDFRGFNMPLLKGIRNRPDGSIQRTAYYISPVLWWKPSESAERKAMSMAVGAMRQLPGAETRTRDRFDALAELVDLALVAYPFSLDAYERAGVNFKYIGHPLGQIALEAAKERKYLKELKGKIAGRRIVGVAPGSRLHELRYHMPVLRELIARLSIRYNDLWFFCPVPSPKLKDEIREGFGLVARLIEFVPDDCYDLMADADLLIFKSGASVQLALLLAVPAVTFYKVASEWMVALGKRFFMDIPYVAFPNLLAGREVIPEYVQSRFNLPNLYVACTELLDDAALAGHMRAELAELRKATMGDDPLGESARALCDLIEGQV
jgi:lipid-A-disaccharide synthase